MTKKELYLPSKNGKYYLHTFVWIPEEEVKAVVQISHGMQEYVDRYDDFARFLAKQGIAVVGNDHLGHGQTAREKSDLGYFTKENPSKVVVEDLHKVTCFAKKKFPNVPYILLGHSMGSFLARRYAMMYGSELDGAIFSGTGAQPSYVLSAGQFIVNMTKSSKGDHEYSDMLDKLSFKPYLKKISSPRTSVDWLTKDEAIVDKYVKDPFCTFRFTVNGYQLLFDTLTYIQNKAHIGQTPKHLPILFAAGDQDPVGHYGKDINSLARTYKNLGIEKVSYKLYENDRHEILNEIDRDIVYHDFLDFISSVIDGK